jgi:hypothetical protein
LNLIRSGWVSFGPNHFTVYPRIGCLTQLVFVAQVNSYAVPYAVSVYGMEFNDSAAHGLSITDLWLAAAKSNEVANGRDPSIFVAKLQESERTFIQRRGALTALLTAYYPNYRHSTADVMHAVFSTPRGSKVDNSVKIDAVHEMLQLKQGEALLNQAHPVCTDWEPELSGGIRRIFAAGKKTMQYAQVFGRKMPPASTQFLAALGKPAQRSLVLYQRARSNLCSLFARPNRELEAGP